ncbi:hypothetical protein SLITO_v1c05890 [Spiroplasma litorale]|uniref:Transmembrane protein n=1 Tax=Spiroplasma litorale TaxID=216942 RepID=A0A0K1W220_9MOLU|nr:hypothetical protein [Spiroplasma litorale]AKX34223.1 hypothetical protein SLITO_v1c05890 [Spiroplasma litorale]
MKFRYKYLINSIASIIIFIILAITIYCIGINITNSYDNSEVLFKGWNKYENGFNSLNNLGSFIERSNFNNFSILSFAFSIILFVISLTYFIYCFVLYLLTFIKPEFKVSSKIQLIVNVIFIFLIILFSLLFIMSMVSIYLDFKKFIGFEDIKMQIGTNFYISVVLNVFCFIILISLVTVLNTKYRENK